MSLTVGTVVGQRLTSRVPADRAGQAVPVLAYVGGIIAAGRSCAPMADMLDHVALQCADLDASADFYDVVLAPLGVRRMVDDESVAFGVDRPMFWLGPRRTGEGFRETHIAFVAAGAEAVTEFFAAAVGVNAEVLYEPRIWPEYHPGYFAAFVRDPDGNNVEAVYHGAT